MTHVSHIRSALSIGPPTYEPINTRSYSCLGLPPKSLATQDWPSHLPIDPCRNPRCAARASGVERRTSRARFPKVVPTPKCSQDDSLPDFVPYAGESDRDSLALQLFDEAHQRVAGTGIDKVRRICVYKNVLRWRAARGQRSPQPIVEATDTCKEKVTAAAPNQQSGERERLRMSPDVAIGLRPRQLSEHCAVRMAGSMNQY